MVVSKSEAKLVSFWSSVGVGAATILAGMAGANYIWTGLIAGGVTFMLAYYGMTHG